MKDIARKTGVSEATVSRVINKDPNVKPATREKVQKIVDDLNYFPNIMAQGMRSKRTRSIGLLLADITNPFYAETAKTIIEIAGKTNNSIILCNTNNDLVEQQRYVNVLLQRKVDGIIFASVHWQDPTVETVIKSGIPCMLYNRRTHDNHNLNYVVLDNELGVYLAIELLFKLGHRRIALIRGPHHFSTGRERYYAYLKALKHFNISNDKSIIVQGNYEEKQTCDAVNKLLSTDNPPTAIFASNDLMAFSALEAIARLNLRIPEDIALVGFDDIKLASHNSIQLTTISQNPSMMAEILLSSIRQIIGNEGLQHPIQIVVKPMLIIRKTCGFRNFEQTEPS